MTVKTTVSSSSSSSSCCNSGCCHGSGPDWIDRMGVITRHISNPSAPPASMIGVGPHQLQIAVTYDSAAAAAAAATAGRRKETTALDGRLLLVIAPPGADKTEPRFTVRADGLDTAQVYGRDVDGWRAGIDAAIVIDDSPAVLGAPLRSVSELPPGRYRAQCVLQVYDTFVLQTGHRVKLPMDRGDGQRWNEKPGNLFSKTFDLDVPQPTNDGATPPKPKPSVVSVVLSEVMPDIEPPVDTAFIKHISVKSELLSRFWGREMRLGAHVLLPYCFEDHPEARFPLMLFHGHYPHDFRGFEPEPPSPDEAPVYEPRFGVDGYNLIEKQTAHDFYNEWTSDGFPRFLVVELQHPCPYYDDSYAVNSASMGPWGDAIMHELLPEIERRFRGIGHGWARYTYGGSTGGWEALAVQVMYPDSFNGCFAACPDPVDFRAYGLTNIYEDSNAYFTYGKGFRKVVKPAARNFFGMVRSSCEQANHMELALGTKGRSCEQWDIWQAVYSPQGQDGFPQPIWDKESGVIDAAVAEYWRENFDLSYIIERDWETLRSKLDGKIHVYTGTADNYYLNNAVYLLEERLRGLAEKDQQSGRLPHFCYEVDYGERAEHCWNGDQSRGNHLSRLRYNIQYLPKILERIQMSAPPGADTTSWRY